MNSSTGKQLQSLVKVLTDLTGKLSNTNPSPSSPEATSHQKPRKSSYECKNAMRIVYRTLKKGDPDFGYDLGKETSFQSQEETTRRIVKGVRDYYNGKDKCPFSAAEIESAAKVFHKSLKDSERRKEKGTHSKHVTMSRRQNRKRERASRLLSAIKMAEYDDKEKLAQLMKPEYMSSEESDMEDGEPIFRVRRLPWLKEKCNKAKDTLDKKHSDSLPINLRKLKRKRVLSVEPSERKPPQSAPGWMLNKTWFDNFNSHM